jgi:hypothetical protein
MFLEEHRILLFTIALGITLDRVRRELLDTDDGVDDRGDGFDREAIDLLSY